MPKPRPFDLRSSNWTREPQKWKLAWTADRLISSGDAYRLARPTDSGAVAIHAREEEAFFAYADGVCQLLLDNQSRRTYEDLE